MQQDLARGRRLGAAAMALGAITIAFSAVLNKAAMGEGMHPVWVNIFRLSLAVAGLLPFFLGKKSARQAVRTLRGKDLFLTLLAGVMLAAHFATWATALSYADSVIAVTIWSTFSLMTVAGSALFLHEKTPPIALIGIVIATLGVGVCAIGSTGSQALGVLFALLAAVTQAVYTLCGRVVRKRLDLTPYTMVAYSVALLCMLLLALVLRVSTVGISASSAGSALLLGLICTLGGHSMQNYALKAYPAPTVSAAIMTEVFTGPLLVFLFLGEAPALNSVVGGVIIMLGVGWYMLYEWRKAHGSHHSNHVPAKRSVV